jgi:hypothetical protein
MSSSTLPHPTTRKQAQSEGGGAPQWLADLGVGPGEYYQTSKFRDRSIMKNPSWSEKARVWCCLSLHTMAFQCEEATKLVKGQRVPLTRGDVAAETGLTPAQVRRALVSLEQEGYAERRPMNGAGLRKGEITICCWAIPRSPKSEPVQDEKLDRLEIPEDLPAYLQKWIRKFRLERLPEPEILEKAGRLAEAMEKSETELKNLLKPADSETQTRTPKKTARGTNLTPFGVPVRLPHIRMKDSGKKEESTIAAAAVVSVPPERTRYVLAAAALQKHFPATEQAFILGLADDCREVLKQMQTEPERLTDGVLRDAVEVAFRPHQRSAALFKTTLPEVIRNWVKNGGKFPDRPVAESRDECRRRETAGLIEYVRGLNVT